MKTFTSAVVIAVVSVMSFTAMAESEVEKSIVVNQSLNQKNATVAIGKENIASTGSVNIKDSKVKDSLIYNKSLNTDNATVAIGEENTAATGSTTVE